MPALTVSQLGSHLWEAANILFGPVDAADFRSYVERIHCWVRDYTAVEGSARVVTLDEIAANDHNLNIPRYLEPKIEQEILTVDEAMKLLRESAEGAFAAKERLVALLEKEKLLTAN